ncbi:MAG: hypothetical protein QM791_02385 [Ferruginibacter sp.]
MNNKMTISLIIAGLLLLIIGMTLGLKNMKPVNFNVFAGIIIVIGTFFGLFGKQLQDKNSSDKSDKILSNTAETYKQLTGGDSYCVIEPNFNAANNQLSFSLKHIGTTSLKNVQITVEDEGRRAYLIQTKANNEYGSKLANKITKETQYRFEFNSINPQTIRNIQIPLENNQPEVRMRIWIFLDNGNIFEYLQISDLQNEAKRKIHLELKRGDEELKTY